MSGFQYLASFIGSAVVYLCKCVFRYVQKPLSLITKANGSPKRMICGDLKRTGRLMLLVNITLRYVAYSLRDSILL